MLKLSFSVKGWEDYSFQDMIDLAIENDYKGIDLCASAYPSYFDKNGAFDKYNSGATMRSLKDKGLNVPVINYSDDMSCENTADTVSKIKDYIDFASSIKVPYVAFYASENESAKANVISVLSQVHEYAYDKNVTILLKTKGLFADTSVLRDVLMEFSCDSIAALWDMYHTYCVKGEEPTLSLYSICVKESPGDARKRECSLYAQNL